MVNLTCIAQPLILLSGILLASGCATTQHSPVKALWLPSAQANWSSVVATGITLRHPDGTTRYVPATVMENLVKVKDRLDRSSSVRADLGLVDTDSPNAFAFHYQGRPVIAISLSWLNQLGHDQDALATTIGHELAHLHLGHSGVARKEREEAARGASQIIGSLLNLAGVPLGGTIANIGVTAFARSFTRDEERAADQLGIRWAVAAYYDPCGKARVAKMYQELRSGSIDIPFLSTHPSYGERSDLANELSQQLRGRPCD